MMASTVNSADLLDPDQNISNVLEVQVFENLWVFPNQKNSDFLVSRIFMQIRTGMVSQI
jgi:hypothetical protein